MNDRNRRNGDEIFFERGMGMERNIQLYIYHYISMHHFMHPSLPFDRVRLRKDAAVVSIITVRRMR